MDAHAPSEYAMHAHGAVFAEVKVDPDLGQMRVTRVVRLRCRSHHQSGCAKPVLWRHDLGPFVCVARAGRRGSAVRPTDERQSAEYRVPVNADVPSLEAILVEEHDPHVNALGIKVSARSALPASRAPSLTPSGTLREFACANSRSRSIA